MILEGIVKTDQRHPRLSSWADRIFRGVVLANASIPDWLGVNLTTEEIESRRKAAIEERMAKLPELDAAIRKALTPRPHKVEIVPAT